MKLVAFPKHSPYYKATPIISSVFHLLLQSNQIRVEMQDQLGVQDRES